MKKNCTNCKHLEWIDGDCEMGSTHNSGFTCNKRYEAMLEQDRESELHNNLDRDKYREHAKVCCDLKPESEMIVELECSDCKGKFTGFKREEGGICFDCYAYNELERMDAIKEQSNG